MPTLRGLVSSARYSVHQALLRARLRKRKTDLPQTHHPLMQRPLVDLAIERTEFSGALTPADEVGTPRLGVDHVFLVSPQMLTDLALEGCIIFEKPKAA